MKRVCSVPGCDEKHSARGYCRRHYMTLVFDQVSWTRTQRRNFQKEHGFSTASHYATGKLRQQILERDGFACVICSMTDAVHKVIYGRPITIDHINRNKRENTEANLQTLCLACHGRKDILPSLKIPRVLAHKPYIMAARQRGDSYQAIANALGFSSAAIWKWYQRWLEEPSDKGII